MNADLLIWLMIYDPAIPETQYSYAMLMWEKRILQIANKLK